METELKLDLAIGDAARLAKAKVLGGRPNSIDLLATYFDTGEGHLAQAGVSLRIRQEGGRRLQTVKAAGATAAGLFVRPEWEREVDDNVPLLDAASGPLEAILQGRPVVPRFTIDVTRAIWLLERGGALIEVALDKAVLRSDGREETFAELELELKHGPVGMLFEVARALGEVVPLRLAALSKAERGVRLAAGVTAAVAKAEPVRLDADGGPADAFATIAHACLRQFRLNEALLLTGDTQPAPLHQARVGLRRLRSAFSLFRPLLRDDPHAAELAAKLRTLAALLGDVRDLDVLAERHTGAARDTIDRARDAAFAQALATLEAPATRVFMLDLIEWLALGGWRTSSLTAEHDLSAFAADLLDRRRRQLKRRGKHLAQLDDDHRHHARIEGKKLRYAAEFFASLWKGKKARHRRRDFLHAIEALQEDLGLLNDVATAPALLARLDLPAETDAPPLDRRHVLKRAAKAHRDLMDVKPFWR